jgi:putative endonuclease
MYFAYILKSEKDGRYYYGSTSNLERRLAAHNAGKVRSTKGRRPLKLIYFEQFTSRSAAFQREQFFKSLDGYIWLKKHRII